MDRGPYLAAPCQTAEQVSAYIQYTSTTLLRYGVGRIDCLQDGDAGKEVRLHTYPVKTIISKVRAESQGH